MRVVYISLRRLQVAKRMQAPWLLVRGQNNEYFLNASPIAISAVQ